nr:uncharacterized protein LOC117684349 [Crassostrea gigas]
MTWHYFFLLFSATLFQDTNTSDQTLTLCADQKGFIRCKNGLKIKIVSANYGRTYDQVCPGGKTDTLTCRSKSSEIKVKWVCNGYAICHLHATDVQFGDPCPNIAKYLEITYRCVKSIDNDKNDKPIVAFNAYTSQHLVFKRNTPVNVVYDKLYFNYGDAYNPHSGFFTAPSAGLYIFTWASVVAPRKIFDTEILVNGKRIGLGNCNNESSSGYENCASTFPFVLNAGDKVNIRTVFANYLHGGGWSSFKGWKV